MKPIRFELLLLMIAAFLAPVIGGHVPTDAQPITGSLLSQLFGGSSLPLGTRLILSVLLLSALGIAYWKHRVVQLPNIRIGFVLSILTILLFSSVFVSDFPYVALRELTAWITYFAVFAAAVAIGGRKGPLTHVLVAAGAGTAVVATRGIIEYASVMADEPTFRIFAGWNNPNAVASILILGTFILTGLLASTRGYKQGLAATGVVLNVTALFLTQSKGGLLALAVGFLALIGFYLINRVPGKKWTFSLLPVAAGAMLAIALTGFASSAANAESGALTRISSAGSQSEQSAGFRQNLWLSAIDLSKSHPIGTGIGTYRFHSAQPGRTDSTVFAHQAYLQMAAESGWVSLLCFLAFSIMWLKYLLSGTRLQPASVSVPKGAIFAACIGFGAHGMIESNLSYYGAGLLFFLLLGLGLQLSTDGTAPEAMPKRFRQAGILVLAVIPLLGHVMFGAMEATKASFMTAIATGNQSSAREQTSRLRDNYGDPESQYLAAFYASPNAEQRVEAMAKASIRYPLPRVFRSLASAQYESGSIDQALATIKRVYKYDPVNLKARHQELTILIEQGRHAEADVAARELIEQESTSYFMIRAIPEAVPTETYEARLYLAKTAGVPEKIKLLEEAILGFQQYALRTRPMVKRMTEGGLPDFAGERPEKVIKKIELATQAAKELKKLYAAHGASSDKEEILTEILGLLEED